MRRSIPELVELIENMVSLRSRYNNAQHYINFKATLEVDEGGWVNNEWLEINITGKDIVMSHKGWMMSLEIAAIHKLPERLEDLLSKVKCSTSK